MRGVQQDPLRSPIHPTRSSRRRPGPRSYGGDRSVEEADFPGAEIVSVRQLAVPEAEPTETAAEDEG